MDKKIRMMEKKEKSLLKDMKHFESDDKKRDKLVKAGKKAMKKKGKKK